MRSYWLGVRVIGTFVALIIAFFFLLTWEPIVERFDAGAAIAQVTAVVSYGFVKGTGWLLGFETHRIGTILGSGPFEVDVAPACSGAVPLSIYFSAVLAFPSSFRARLLGLLLGTTVIFAVNVLRVGALFLVGLFFREVFHESHVYVAQALVICVAVALWLFWATRYAMTPQAR